MKSDKMDESRNDIIGRREFFKRTVKGVLPILGGLVLSVTPIQSVLATSCSDCSGSCSGDCAQVVIAEVVVVVAVVVVEDAVVVVPVVAGHVRLIVLLYVVQFVTEDVRVIQKVLLIVVLTV